MIVSTVTMQVSVKVAAEHEDIVLISLKIMDLVYKNVQQK